MAFLVAIVGAEYVIGIVQKGTHDWRLFIRPEELHSAFRIAGFQDFSHFAFDPSLRALAELSLFRLGVLPAESMKGSWHIQEPSHMMISYIGHATRA